MKHANLQLIFTITLPIENTAIQLTITLKKKITTDQPNHNIDVVVESYPVLPSDFYKIMQHFLRKKTQKTQIKKTNFKSPNTSEINT